jgi:hypothetical protein
MGSMSATVELELDLDIEYKYTKGRPAAPPAYSHGGLPPDPPEIDIISIKSGKTVIDYDSLPDAKKEEIDDLIIDHETGLEPDYD